MALANTNGLRPNGRPQAPSEAMETDPWMTCVTSQFVVRTSVLQ